MNHTVKLHWCDNIKPVMKLTAIKSGLSDCPDFQPLIPLIKQSLQAYVDRDYSKVYVPRNALTGTPFQIAVWDYLCTIPPGQTRSYRTVAHAIGNPTASRAVANAVAANPLMILIPCHRIIRASGKLGQYAGGSDLKQQLLHHETDPINRCVLQS